MAAWLFPETRLEVSVVVHLHQWDNPAGGFGCSTCLAMLMDTAGAACKVKVRGWQSQGCPRYPWTSQAR